MKRNLTDIAALLWQIVCFPCAAATSEEDIPPQPDDPDSSSETTSRPADKHYRIPKKRLKRGIAVVLVALPVLGFLVAASGIMPIKASSGHWPITAWFLNFSMGRSVSTHSVGIKVPPLNDQGLILRGAGHYHISCRPCHGSPGRRMPGSTRAMTPHPPYLPPKINEWSPAELFYIVKHGVKFTGMPAWPAEGRDDEIWAVTAFLLTLPDLDQAGYQQLISASSAAGESATPEVEESSPRADDNVRQLARNLCADCHGIDGAGRGAGAFPSLAGQHADYLAAAMQAYASGTRHSGIMETVATSMAEEDFRPLAEFYGAMQSGGVLRNTAPENESPAETAREQLAESIERGRQIAERGIPDEKIPACIDCHGPTSHPVSRQHPVLAGQDEWYLLLQLDLFHAGTRGGSERGHIMQPIAGRLKPEQIQDVSAWYASLAPQQSAAARSDADTPAEAAPSRDGTE